MFNACRRSSQNGDQNHLGEKGIAERKGWPSLITVMVPGRTLGRDVVFGLMTEVIAMNEVLTGTCSA